jgi:hypothetical protein
MQAETWKHLEGSDGKHAQFLRQQRVALELPIKAIRSKASRDYEKCFEASNSNGMKVEVYGSDRAILDARSGAEPALRSCRTVVRQSVGA